MKKAHVYEQGLRTGEKWVERFPWTGSEKRRRGAKETERWVGVWGPGRECRDLRGVEGGQRGGKEKVVVWCDYWVLTAHRHTERERERQCVGEQLRAKRFIPFNVYLCACMRGTILQKGVGCVWLIFSPFVFICCCCLLVFNM